MNNRHTFRALAAAVIMAASLLIVAAGCEKEQKQVEMSWVDETYSGMSDQEKIGQMFCLTVDPIRYFLFPEYKNSINTLIGKYQPGAVFFTANLDSVDMETRNEFSANKLHDESLLLQEMANVPLFISADFNSGAWYWDFNATRFPSPIALAASRSPEYAYRQGKITAVEAKSQGITWIMSPVVNLSVQSENNDLVTRSLGSNTETVTDLGSRYIRGCQEVGIAACMKYFPSDAVHALVTMPTDSINQNQLDVFQAGIETGVLSIMGSPLEERFGDRQTESATMRENIGILRSRLGFDGIFVSELHTSFDPDVAPETAHVILDAMDAGMTMFILPENFTTEIPFIDILFEESLAGAVDMDVVERSAHTIIDIKSRLNLSLVKSERSLRSMAGLGLPEFYQTTEELSESCITLLKNDNDILPIDADESYVLSVSFFDELSPNYTTIYSEKIAQNTESRIHINIFGEPDQRVRHEVERRAKEADIILCSFFLKTSDIPGVPTVTPEVRSLIETVRASNRSIIALSFNDPFLINQLPEVEGYIYAYSPSLYSIGAAVKAVFGTMNPQGIIPIDISEELPAGTGLGY